MKTSLQREIEDPENFAQAYAYDPETQFYKGLIRRQEDPRRPGTFLMPAYSTEKRPTFLEGHRPRWNGAAWELVPKVEAMKMDAKVQRELGEVKDRLITDTVASLEIIIESRAEQKFRELHHELIRLMEEKAAHIFEACTRQAESAVDVKVDKECGRLSDLFAVVVQEISEIEKRAHDVHAQTLAAANQVLEGTISSQREMTAAVEALQQSRRKFWEFWKAKEKPSETLQLPEGGA